MSFSKASCLARAVLAVVAGLLASCGTPLSGGPDRDLGVAIIAVEAAPDVPMDLSSAGISALLADSLTAEDGRPVTPLPHTRTALGPDRHESLAREFAATGRLVNDSLQAVMATPLGARRGLLIRVEHNDAQVLEPLEQPYVSPLGQDDQARRSVVLASRRDVRVSATLLDLTTGSVRWARAWTASPVARSQYVRYVGSSFSGSVTATIANSVVNGLRGPAAPPPPSLSVALESIFRELARDARIR